MLRVCIASGRTSRHGNADQINAQHVVFKEAVQACFCDRFLGELLTKDPKLDVKSRSPEFYAQLTSSERKRFGLEALVIIGLIRRVLGGNAGDAQSTELDPQTPRPDSFKAAETQGLWWRVFEPTAGWAPEMKHPTRASTRPHMGGRSVDMGGRSVDVSGRSVVSRSQSTPGVQGPNYLIQARSALRPVPPRTSPAHTAARKTDATQELPGRELFLHFPTLRAHTRRPAQAFIHSYVPQTGMQSLLCADRCSGAGTSIIWDIFRFSPEAESLQPETIGNSLSSCMAELAQVLKSRSVVPPIEPNRLPANCLRPPGRQRSDGNGILGDNWISGSGRREKVLAMSRSISLCDQENLKPTVKSCARRGRSQEVVSSLY